MNVPYEIKPIAPKGLGLFATRLIKKGEMIWDPRSDDAAIAMPDAQLASYLGTYEPAQIDYILDHGFCWRGVFPVTFRQPIHKSLRPPAVGG
jgi:hypothetical protein